MSVTTSRTRFVNPRLGTFFGIFTSLFASLFLVQLILVELGIRTDWLRFAAFVGPMTLYAVFAVASYTREPFEYFAAGRRVPAVYNGLVLALSAAGGTTFVCLSGALFLNGYDAWCIVMGATAGFVCMAMLIAPYIRKFGAYTVPTFLARRLESRAVRVTAAACFAVPMLLVLTAELRIGVWIARELTGSSAELLLAILAASVAFTTLVGGMRATTWSGSAQAIAALFAIVLLAGVAGVLMTNLPVPQLSGGPTLREIDRLEAALGVPIPEASHFAFSIASNELAAVTGRMAEPFATVGLASFVLTSLTLAMGVAAAPWLVQRCASTPGVYEARKSLGWTVLFFGMIVVTGSSVAILLRNIFMTELVGRSQEALPQWFQELRASGLADVVASVPSLPVNALQIHRDAVIFALPGALGLTEILVYLILAGAIGAVLVAASTTAHAFGSIIAEDVIGGLRWAPAPASTRVLVGRLSSAVILVVASMGATMVNTDPLALFLSALTISAATAFPALVVAVWWRRATAAGILSALLSGFLLSVVAISMAPSSVGSVANPVAGFAAVVVPILVAVVVSKFTPQPSGLAIERLREMRIPGGETIYDRELRLLRLRQRETTQPMT